MKKSLLYLPLCSGGLVSTVAFLPPSPTKTQHRVPHIKTSESYSITDNEHLRLEATKPNVPTETRRGWIQKLSGPVAAIAASFLTKRDVHAIAASKSKTTLPLPASSALSDPTVLTLTKGPRTIHIVGTAHISSVSADLAGRLVQETAPDAVFVELDAARLSRAFQGGIPPSGVNVAIQDDAGNLKVGVTQKPGLGQQLLIKFINSLSNPGMYRKLEMAGIPVGQEVRLLFSCMRPS